MGDVKRKRTKATQTQKSAQAAVDAITADLNDRSGCGIDGLDAAIRREIRAKWSAIVAKAIDAAVAEEREACAKLAEWPDDEPDKFDGYHAGDVAQDVAANIRARGRDAQVQS